MAGGFFGILPLTGWGFGTVGSGGPVIESLGATQRDAATTYLVDLPFRVYNPATPGMGLGLTMEFSTVSDLGPWSSSTPQQFDRRHTVLFPNALPPVPTVSPGTLFNYVWRPIFDLLEGYYPQVWARVRVTDVSLQTDERIHGPFVLDLRAVATPDPLAAQLTKSRSLSAASLDFLGEALAFPLQRGSRDFVSVRGVAAVRSALRVVFRTKAAHGAFMGDLDWRPNFGHRFWTLRFHNNDAVLEAKAYAYAQEAFAWCPRAVLSGALVEPPASLSDLNTASIRMVYGVITENVAGNRVVQPSFTETVSLG